MRFLDSKYEKGLAEALRCEAKDAKHKIYLCHELPELLERIRTEVTLDQRAFVSQVWEHARDSIESLLERNSFTVVGEPTVEAEKFVTEDTNRLYITFRIFYQCEDLMDNGRYGAVLILKGNCVYLCQEKKFDAFRQDTQEVIFKNKDGEEIRNRNVFAYADGSVIGHKIEVYSINYPLDK